MNRHLPYSLAILLFATSISAQNAQRGAGRGGQGQQTPGNATIQGVVTRVDNGQPLKGARVALRRANNNEQANALLAAGALAANASALANVVGAVANVTTDSSGRFTITGVAAGSYQMSAEYEGFVRSEYGQRTPTGRGVSFPVAASQTVNVDMKMLRASVVSGRVITPDGLPAARANVQAYMYQYSGGERTLAQVTATQTNDLGEYRLFWLQPGEYFVAVMTDEVIDEGPVGAVDLNSTRGRGLGAGAAIQALTAVLGDRGGAIAPALNRSNLSVYYPGTIDPGGAVPIAVAAAAEVRSVDFNLQVVRPPTVSGRIVAPFPLDATPVNGRGGRGGLARGAIEAATNGGNVSRAPVQVTLNRIGGSRGGIGALMLLGSGSTPVNTDGTFEIKTVAPGEYNVTAIGRDANGQEYTGRTRITVSNQDVTNLAVTLRAGVEVRGKVLLDGTPPQQFKMTNVRVNLVGEDSPLGDVAGLIALAGASAGAGGRGGRGGDGGGRAGGLGALVGAASATVAEDGTFVLPNVGAMEYRVRVTGLPQGAYVQTGRLESKDALDGPITVDNGGALLQLQLGFSTGRVSGVVSDDRQAPVPGVQAVLVPDESRRGRRDAYFTTTADANGQFNLNNVPPGRYKAFAWEDIPAGAYQYPDFLKQYEDRGQSITVNANGAVTADVRLIPAK
jgi:hypothetical protein